MTDMERPWTDGKEKKLKRTNFKNINPTVHRGVKMFSFSLLIEKIKI